MVRCDYGSSAEGEAVGPGPEGDHPRVLVLLGLLSTDYPTRIPLAAIAGEGSQSRTEKQERDQYHLH
ncbi:hypothetical protein L9G16_19540, partial [Shewanella sp. A25]|nr:hypothetical protein [Shewanella shenzhenensis]